MNRGGIVAPESLGMGGGNKAPLSWRGVELVTMCKTAQMPGYPSTDIRNRILRMLTPPEQRPPPAEGYVSHTLRMDADRVICLPLKSHRCPVQSSITGAITNFGASGVSKTHEVDVIDFLLHVWLEAKVPVYYITVSSEQTGSVKVGYLHMRSQSVECLAFPFDRITDTGLTESCYTELQRVAATVMCKIPGYPLSREESEDERKTRRNGSQRQQSDGARAPPFIADMYAPFTETSWPVFVMQFCTAFGRPVVDFGGIATNWMDNFSLSNTFDHICAIADNNLLFMRPPERHRPRLMFTGKALTVTPDEACLLTVIDSKRFNASPSMRSLHTRPGAAICRPCFGISDHIYDRVKNDVTSILSNLNSLVRCGLNAYLWGHSAEMKQALSAADGNHKFAIIADFLNRYTQTVGLKHEGFRDMCTSLREDGMDPQDFRPQSEGVRFMAAFNNSIDSHTCPSTMSKLIEFIKAYLSAKGYIPTMTHVRVALLTLATCIRGIGVHDVHPTLMSMFTIITGPPGTGKSAIVSLIRSLLPASAVYTGVPTVAALSRSVPYPTGCVPQRGAHMAQVGLPDDVAMPTIFSATGNLATMLELITTGTTCRTLVEDQGRGVLTERGVVNAYSAVYCTNDRISKDNTALGDRMIVASIKHVVIRLSKLDRETSRFAHERSIDEFTVDRRAGASGARPTNLDDDDPVVASLPSFGQTIIPHYVYYQNLTDSENTVRAMSETAMRSVFAFAARIAFVSNLLGGQNTRMEEMYTTMLNSVRRRVNARAVTNVSQLQRNFKCLLWAFTLYNTVMPRLLAATLKGRHNNRLHYPVVDDITDDELRAVMPLAENVIMAVATYTCDLPSVVAATTVCSVNQETANVDFVLETLAGRARYQAADSPHPVIHRMDSGHYVELERPPSISMHVNVFCAIMRDPEGYSHVIQRLMQSRVLILGLQGEPMMDVDAYYSSRQWPECTSELRSRIFDAKAPCLAARYHECMVPYPMGGSVECILVPGKLAEELTPSFQSADGPTPIVTQATMVKYIASLRSAAAPNSMSTVEWLRYVAFQSAPWMPTQMRTMFAPHLASVPISNCPGEYIFAELPEILKPVYTKTGTRYKLVPKTGSFYANPRESDQLLYRAWDRDLLPKIYIQAMEEVAGENNPEAIQLFSPKMVFYPQAIAGTKLAQAQSYDGILYKIPGMGKCVNLETEMTTCPTHEGDRLVDNARAGMVSPECCGISSTRSPYQYPTKPTHLVINAYTPEVLTIAAMYANQMHGYVDLAWCVLNGDVNSQTSQRSVDDPPADVVLPAYYNPCGRIQRRPSDILHHSQLTYMLMVCHHLRGNNVNQVAAFVAFAAAVRERFLVNYDKVSNWLYEADAAVYRFYDMPDRDERRNREMLWEEMGLRP